MAGVPGFVSTAGHPTLMPGQLSNYSTLSGANTGCVLPASGKENRIPSSQRYITRADSPLSSRRVRIPTQPLTPSPGRVLTWPKMAIHFNPQEGGVYFADVDQQLVESLRSGNECVFPLVQQGRAEFRILWPGYGHMAHTYNIPTVIHGRPITRRDLARHVVAFYRQFWEEARRAQVSPGNECWAVKRFDFDELVLVSISNCDGHDAVFQAVVEVPRL
ncbi:hypothetical protein BD310DRAFT_952021 [Dichomitus squalens]|uniref:Uncharacterized protein n=1 Tax=Dichomitus squalens TaxID=114155 RepID=A0A4Q9PF57_9APHY|nr:hypothetical protein BD310DRAFT_952021 [Dichomitus squalens]